MTIKDHYLLHARWPAPEKIKTLITTRHGGISQAPWDSLNLAQHVGDDYADVEVNRSQIVQRLPSRPIWLQQTHSKQIIDLSEHNDKNDSPPQADASFSHTIGQVCAVLTADCLPLLLTNSQGEWVAAIHAGWRGLVSGIIQNAVTSICTKFKSAQSDILVYLGPAIGPDAFEVGSDVYQAFMLQNNKFAQAFRPSEDKYYADIYHLARIILNELGIKHIFGGDYCSYSDQQRFYSYRRDGQTGRMASLIWIDDTGK